jgi:signal transduction histidine kinase
MLVQAAEERLLALSLLNSSPRLRWLIGYGIAIFGTLAVAALKFTIPAFGAPGPDLFLTIPVAASAILAGFRPAFVATLGTTFLAAYFTPPIGIGWGPNSVDVVGFFVEGLIIAAIGAAARRAFARTVESLRKQEELEGERSALIATVNHELRNPLASLSGHLQLASRYAAREEMRDRVPASLAEAQHQISRLLRLADDLLLVSRPAEALPIEMSTLDLGIAIMAAARRAEAIAPTHPVNASVPRHALLVTADPTRLDQILDNILKNASSYSQTGAPIEICAKIEGERGVVRVRDQGRGVDPADKDRIFDRFARGAGGSPVPGMGLGLYVSRELATRMGGRLELEETSPSGSLFAVSLRIARAPIDVAPEPEEEPVTK